MTKPYYLTFKNITLADITKALEDKEIITNKIRKQINPFEDWLMEEGYVKSYIMYEVETTENLSIQPNIIINDNILLYYIGTTMDERVYNTIKYMFDCILKKQKGKEIEVINHISNYNIIKEENINIYALYSIYLQLRDKNTTLDERVRQLILNTKVNIIDGNIDVIKDYKSNEANIQIVNKKYNKDEEYNSETGNTPYVYYNIKYAETKEELKQVLKTKNLKNMKIKTERKTSLTILKNNCKLVKYIEYLNNNNMCYDITEEEIDELSNAKLVPNAIDYIKELLCNNELIAMFDYYTKLNDNCNKCVNCRYCKECLYKNIVKAALKKDNVIIKDSKDENTLEETQTEINNIIYQTINSGKDIIVNIPCGGGKTYNLYSNVVKLTQETKNKSGIALVLENHKLIDEFVDWINAYNKSIKFDKSKVKIHYTRIAKMPDFPTEMSDFEDLLNYYYELGLFTGAKIYIQQIIYTLEMILKTKDVDGWIYEAPNADKDSLDIKDIIYLDKIINNGNLKEYKTFLSSLKKYVATRLQASKEKNIILCTHQYLAVNKARNFNRYIETILIDEDIRKTITKTNRISVDKVKQLIKELNNYKVDNIISLINVLEDMLLLTEDKKVSLNINISLKDDEIQILQEIANKLKIDIKSILKAKSYENKNNNIYYCTIQDIDLKDSQNIVIYTATPTPILLYNRLLDRNMEEITVNNIKLKGDKIQFNKLSCYKKELADDKYFDNIVGILKRLKVEEVITYKEYADKFRDAGFSCNIYFGVETGTNILESKEKIAVVGTYITNPMVTELTECATRIPGIYDLDKSTIRKIDTIAAKQNVYTFVNDDIASIQILDTMAKLIQASGRNRTLRHNNRCYIFSSIVIPQTKLTDITRATQQEIKYLI